MLIFRYDCFDHLHYSEDNLQSELNLPGGICASNRSEGRVGEVRIGRTKIRLIEHVEELGPKLHFTAFAHRDWKRFLQRDIQLPEIGRTKRVPADVTVRLTRRRQLESGSI